MIRQAHTYLVGAMSGTVLIGAAIAVFVMLVSAQVFHDWPVASLGSGGPDKTEVSDARSVSQAPPARPAASSIAAARANARASAPAPVHKSSAHAKSGGNDSPAANGAELALAKPDTSAGSENPLSGGESPGSSTGSEGGSQGGSPHSTPTPAPSTPAPTPGGGGSGGSGGGETPTGGGGETAPTPAPTSKALTETVNKTVTGVTETATGGAAGTTGVTHVTEEVVNGVAGPESVVGNTVDGVGSAVGGLLGAGK